MTRVAVLGGAGFIGRRVVAALRARTSVTGIVALTRSARAPMLGVELIRADVCDASALTQALQGAEVVVNAVTGNAANIVAASRALAQVLAQKPATRLVQLSSMAVYEGLTGRIVEQPAPRSDQGNWYARAKRAADDLVSPLAGPGRTVALLRPGCVIGPGSELWVTRVGHWLTTGRLGDLRQWGDGWSNLVDVDEVAQATAMACLQPHLPSLGVYHLVKPDQPRWNDYLLRFGLALGGPPLATPTRAQLLLDSRVAAVPLRVWERVSQKLGRAPRWPALAPSFLRLLASDQWLDATEATGVLGVQWEPWSTSCERSADWYRSQHPRSNCEHD